MIPARPSKNLICFCPALNKINIFFFFFQTDLWSSGIVTTFARFRNGLKVSFCLLFLYKEKVGYIFPGSYATTVRRLGSVPVEKVDTPG